MKDERPTFSKRDGQLGQGAGLTTDAAVLEVSMAPEPVTQPVKVTAPKNETPRLPWEEKGEGHFVKQ